MYFYQLSVKKKWKNALPFGARWYVTMIFYTKNSSSQVAV